MLRISWESRDGRPVLKLEGRLTDVWVSEAEMQWTTALALVGGTHLTVDLRDVLCVDAAGRQLLGRMRKGGAVLEVAGCAMRALLAEQDEGVPGDSQELMWTTRG